MKTILSPDTVYVCVFCNAEYESNVYLCCDDYKGITALEDVVSYYPDLYEIGE